MNFINSNYHKLKFVKIIAQNRKTDIVDVFEKLIVLLKFGVYFMTKGIDGKFILGVGSFLFVAILISGLITSGTVNKSQRDRSKIISHNLFTKIPKTLDILQTKCELIFEPTLSITIDSI